VSVPTKTKPKEGARVGPSVKGTLFVLQEKLSETLQEVNNSYDLYKLGEKTKLAQLIEASIQDPLNTGYKLSVDIDNNVKCMIDLVVKNFFLKNKDIIDSVYRTKTPRNDLHYCVVLKEDNPKNRTNIFSFFNTYDSTNFSEKFPVYFQFVPAKLIEKVFVHSKLNIE
jgi:hypothetical protein